MQVERYPNELTGIKYNMVVLKPNVIDPLKKYPLVIELVGLGAAKMDNILALENDIPPNVKLVPDAEGMIILAVQTPDTYDDEITFALDWAFKNLPVSPDTGVYASGFSYGGSLWKFISDTPENAKVFDAVAPIATVWTSIVPGGWKNIADANLPIWAFHNMYDNNAGTPVDATKSYVSEVNKLKPGLATMTLFKSYVHSGWNEAANTVSPPIAPGGEGLTTPAVTLWKWFKMNSRTKRVAPPSTTTTTPLPIEPAPVLTPLYAKATAKIEGDKILLAGDVSKPYDMVAWTDKSAVKSVWEGGTGWVDAVSKPLAPGFYTFELKVGRDGKFVTSTVTVDFKVVSPSNPVTKTILHSITLPSGKKLTVYSDETSEIR